MRLSDFSNKHSYLIADGFFDVLAPSTAKVNKRVLTFLEEEKYIDVINSDPKITSVICTPELANRITKETMGILCVEQPKLFFFQLHNELVSNKLAIRKKNKTLIGDNCKISPLASISEFNVIIGSNVEIEEFVSIKSNVKIGDNTIIRSGSVLGGQGFEFKKNNQHSILRVEHAGMTIVEDDVEIKEMCTVHQSVFDWDYTRIGRYSKLDAHTHIGHASKIGNRVLIGSHVNISGNVCVEDDVYVGPGVTISNRLTIGRQSRISLGSVVTKDVEESKTVTGNFAINHDLFIKDLKNKVNQHTN